MSVTLSEFVLTDVSGKSDADRIYFATVSVTAYRGFLFWR